MGLFGIGRKSSEEVAFTPKIIKELGENAVQISKEEFGIDLNFSSESLSRLEGAISEKFPNPSESSASSGEGMQFVIAIGSYISEVLIRNLGGKWEIEPFTNDEFPHALMEKVAMNVGPLKVFPFAKVWKRFAYGEEDSLTSYYEMLAKVSRSGATSTQG